MNHRRNTWVLGCLVAMVTVCIAYVGQASAAGPPGQLNQCLGTGWAEVHRADGTSFTSVGDCTHYVATGGSLALLRVSFTYPDASFDPSFFRAEGTGSGLLPGSTVEMWARFADASVSPWLGDLAGQTIRVNGGTVGSGGTTITPETAAPTFFGNYLRCSAPVGPFPGQLWEAVWVTGTSSGGASFSSPLYGYASSPGLPC